MNVPTPTLSQAHQRPVNQRYTDLTYARLRRRIRWLLAFMMAGLIISGVTAIPLSWEINLLHTVIGPDTWMQDQWPAMASWIDTVHQALTVVAKQYPLLLYGTDWLAFAHIVIALLFIGPYRDPVRNIWVIEFGLIACVLVIPVALLFGQLRGIPFFWRLIDCSFGVVGFIPLWIARQQILKLEKLLLG